MHEKGPISLSKAFDDEVNSRIAQMLASLAYEQEQAAFGIFSGLAGERRIEGLRLAALRHWMLWKAWPVDKAVKRLKEMRNAK